MAAMMFVLPLLIIAAVVLLALGGGVVALIVFGVNKAITVIPLFERIMANPPFKKYYPLVCGGLFAILGGAFFGSAIDAYSLIAIESNHPYREAFNYIVLGLSPIVSIFLLGIFVGLSRIEERGHIVLQTLLFSCFGMMFFTLIWRYLILMASNVGIGSFL